VGTTEPRVVVPKIVAPGSPGGVEVASSTYVPVLVTDDLVMFPGMMTPLVIVRDRDKSAIDEALVKFRVVLTCARMPGAQDVDSPGPEHIYRFGTTCQVLKKIAVPDGSQRVLLQGNARTRVVRWVQSDPYILADTEAVPQDEDPEEDSEFAALVRHVLSQFERVVELSDIPQEAYITALNVGATGKLGDVIAANTDLPVSARQLVLETTDSKDRLHTVSEMVSGELAVLELRDKLRTETRGEMERAQRQYYLRQQLEAIRKELGEANEQEQELDDLRQAIERSGMSEQAQKQADRELQRLARMTPASAEYSVARTWLDWLIRFPWAKATEDRIELGYARTVLDEDHYDLQKIKERILEYLAVMTLNPGQQGPILCFVGPPGVGKTSLGMSIARALGRRFVRMSLGGMRDEAEIRGHRRTYIGALPGRIVQGMCQAESRNPVYMLDEVDKIGMDFRGDPASALLEVLDPAQNKAFRDLYLDVDVDLSKVMFITTANVLDTIPPALQDRMEVLRLSGYTLREKVEIAVRHLVPRQLKGHGLPPGSLRFRRAGIEEVIAGYTREAGVRNLERELASICRKRARQYVEGATDAVAVVPAVVDEFLGHRRFRADVVERHKTPGVVAGLAYTATGGDVLFVEAALVRGGSGLTLTGSLGDVMKESARAALTCIRNRVDRLGVDPALLSDSEVHIHVPSGAVPKDGPSAGVTMAVALASLLTGRPAKHDVAMTGEITLQGRILQIGGLKEKVLAGVRAGVHTIILPHDNVLDLDDVPEEARKRARFVPIDTLDEAIEAALTPASKKRTVRSK